MLAGSPSKGTSIGQISSPGVCFNPATEETPKWVSCNIKRYIFHRVQIFWATLTGCGFLVFVFYPQLKLGVIHGKLLWSYNSNSLFFNEIFETTTDFSMNLKINYLYTIGILLSNLASAQQKKNQLKTIETPSEFPVNNPQFQLGEVG